MASPLSIRLNDDVLATLDGAARARGIGLATDLRDLAGTEARRIREQCRPVADSAEAQVFFANRGTPAAKLAP